MDILLAVAKLSLVLGTVVLLHELGHLVLAKLNGVHAPSFSIGFGKVLWKKTWGETEYRFSLIPLGGYVQMAGHGEEAGKDDGIPENRLFSHKSPLQKLSIVVAGPLTNLLSAAILFVLLTFVRGVPVIPPVVGEVVPGSGAETAGLLPGDIIKTIDGVTISDFADIPPALSVSGETVSVVVERSGTGKTIAVPVGTLSEKNVFGDSVKRRTIGVTADMQSAKMATPGIVRGINDGVSFFWEVTTISCEAMIRMFTGRMDITNLSGPIGIGDMIYHQQEKAASAIFMILSLIGVISVNIGLLNLLPIPVLDGGHVVIHLFELIGIRIPEKAIRFGSYAGMAALVGLMVMTTGLDLAKLAGFIPR